MISNFQDIAMHHNIFLHVSFLIYELLLCYYITIFQQLYHA